MNPLRIVKVDAEGDPCREQGFVHTETPLKFPVIAPNGRKAVPVGA